MKRLSGLWESDRLHTTIDSVLVFETGCPFVVVHCCWLHYGTEYSVF